MTPHQRARIENLLKHGVTVRVPRGQDIDIILTNLEVERGIMPPPAFLLDLHASVAMLKYAQEAIDEGKPRRLRIVYPGGELVVKFTIEKPSTLAPKQ